MPKALAIYVNHAGDSMDGTLDMKNNIIINIPDPLDPKDSFNKSYFVATENRTKEYFDQNGETTRIKVKTEVDDSLTKITSKLKADVVHDVDEKSMTLKEPISKESVKYVLTIIIF